MRDYLSESNLVKAAGLAVVLTVMSLGRLIEARQPLGLYIPATFVAMTLIAGAVTAWGQRAGMPGIVTDRRTFLRGAAVAAGLSLLALPLYLFVLDPLLKTALLTSRHRTIVELRVSRAVQPFGAAGGVFDEAVAVERQPHAGIAGETVIRRVVVKMIEADIDRGAEAKHERFAERANRIAAIKHERGPVNPRPGEIRAEPQAAVVQADLVILPGKNFALNQ